MPKPEGLYSIGEMAVACGISINALRFYETKVLIKPAHTDPESGYRYYSRENLHRLRAMRPQVPDEQHSARKRQTRLGQGMHPLHGLYLLLPGRSHRIWEKELWETALSV